MILDIQLSLEQAGDNEKLAKELLYMLLKELPNLLESVKSAFHLKNYPSLKNNAHKMHGATAYCGVPNLKQAAHDLENCIKQDKTQDIQSAINELEVTIQQLQSNAVILLKQTWA